MYTEILVCISEEPGRENLITTAAQFAKQHNARLSGMFVSIHHDMPIPMYGLMVVDQVLLAAERDKVLYREGMQQFKEITEGIGVKSHWIADSKELPPVEVSRYTDLVIASQGQEDNRSGDNNYSLLNSLVLETGKPVMLVPINGKQSALGKNILLGWDETREAARAVGDAMPLLQAAEKVHIAFVVDAGADVINPDLISDYLNAQGVSNEIHLLSKDKTLNTTAQVIEDFGETVGADLFVLGGYGHSKLREIVLGGVTRHMMRKTSVPVLMSH